MNEIIGPIYFLFANDPNLEFRGKTSFNLKLFFKKVLFFYILMFDKKNSPRQTVFFVLQI